MIKTLAAAAVLSLGLAGYAMAQDTPAAAPAAPMAEPVHHHHVAPEAAPAPAPAQ